MADETIADATLAHRQAMAELITLDANLTPADRLVLEGMIRDVRAGRDYEDDNTASCQINGNGTIKQTGTDAAADADVLSTLDGLNDETDSRFEPTVFTSADWRDVLQAAATARKDAAGTAEMHVRARLRAWAQVALLERFVRLAQDHIVRHRTDVVFATHLLCYLGLVVPSAATLLFWHFSWLHGLLHTALVLATCIGSYTIMMHQHIHQGGVLRRDRVWTRAVDRLFPYLLDPLMGHTWNSYFYHHVKHHHVEGNGPDDLSSTLRFRRDSLLDFSCYLGRFLVLAWFDLPLYFYRTHRYHNAVRAGFWELSSYVLLVGSYLLGSRAVLVTAPGAAFCVFLLPFAIMRMGLMLGNWGQHAFVDPDSPDSDFRSSITLVDVASNRVCFNDGYHTSHHLNPRRHWRDHPRAFVRQKRVYAAERALVFFGIDYLEITLRLILWQDYKHLALCLAPLGPEQCRLSLDERADMLRRHTTAFSEADIARFFPKTRSAAAWRRKQGLPAE
ncbi:phosphoinositide 3-kinase regulatory subunit 4 [Grosmannia clavigera kw1407]|uniref:Phosphoinositide 3-kinase regulatory subunit 4 n=1 Tax=Grosmannia clavigera (strain kw1407 / UAMH 11150) TaxID=655863 RepID=F0XL91_GROCL|nr:phosphoinositide 3-kinase regulatory subunit 4 [Grosmannia clavigera kw1407]EFX01183.1 phosphoinositide 3-kinase regulatory subunit 4 [Grosmannia clavigera kw1407]